MGGVVAHYEDITPDMPPANEPAVCGEWWGCKDWMVKAGTPRFPDGQCIRTLVVAPPLLVLAVSQGTSAVDAQLGLARWGRHGDGHPVASVPIEAADGYGVNLLYLHYASAIAEVEQWCWLPTDDLRHLRERHKDGGALVGLRGDEAVAVVCPMLFNRVAGGGR